MPIPQNDQTTQYNAPVETGCCTTNIEQKGQSSLSYWEYESIQARCIQLQDKNDQLRESLEKEVKAKLTALTDMQKELAKGEVARVKVEQLETERKDLRESLEQAKERAERVLFRKDQQLVDFCPTESMMQNTDPNDQQQSLLQKLVSEANEIQLSSHKKDDDYINEYGQQNNMVVKQVPVWVYYVRPINRYDYFFSSGHTYGEMFFVTKKLFSLQKIEFFCHQFLKKYAKTYFCELGSVLRLGLDDSLTIRGRG